MTTDQQQPTPTEVWWIVRATDLGGSETLMFASEDERDDYLVREN